MRHLRRTALCASLMAVCVAAPHAWAQAPDDKPAITEETPYVISPTPVVDTMLKMAGVRATDFLIDLGSGDGRIVITAAKEYGARGFGVDYDPRLVRLANENAKKAGVADRITFVEQDLFKTDFSQASVITMYLLEEYNAALKPKLLALKAGTRIVSHDYGIGDWEPDAKMKIAVPDKPVGLEKASIIMFWLVPAKVEGDWTARVPGLKGWTDARIHFEQHNQKISGEALIDGHKLPLDRASLSGESVSFRVQHGDRTIRFSGLVRTGRIAGEVAVSGGRNYRWRALRSKQG
jgi:precorrin-6B methylase 2